MRERGTAVRTEPEHVLSPLEYERVCAELGVERMPYPVEFDRHGETMAERAELFASADETLAAKRFRDRGGIVEELAAVVLALARASTTVDVLAFDEGPVRAAAAHTRTASALVVIAAGQVLLRRLPDVPPAQALLGLFPDSPAGPGQSVPVPLAAFRQLAGAGGDGDAPEDPLFTPGRLGDAQVLGKHGVSAMDAVRVCAIAEERFRGGQFGVLRHAGGRAEPRRDGVVLSFFDTQAGRYLMVNDGAWVSITPADSVRIARRIEQAVLDAS